MKLSKTAIIIIIIIIILVVWFFPKKISDCGGDSLCFGYVRTETQKSTWLNVLDSTFEIRETTVKSCIGPTYQYEYIMDGCPGNWGWFNAAPISCDTELHYCLEPNQIRTGIKCSEWQRVCEEIKSHNNVSIVIENISATGIRVVLNE